MFDIDLYNPLHKLVISRLLLDAKYDGPIANFTDVIPDVFSISANRRGKIFIKCSTHVPMKFDETRSITGRNLISEALAGTMYEGINGHYINLSARLYDLNADCLTYLRKMNLPIRNGVHEVSDNMIRYYVYYLIELDMNPDSNIYDRFLVRRRRTLSSFESMRDSIKDSLTYKLQDRFGYGIEKGTASASSFYSWYSTPYVSTRNFYDY